MWSAKESNLKMLAHVANKLGNLIDRVVFVGGCTTALFITDASIPDVRFTNDVDCITDVISYYDYSKIEKQLRKLGFKQTMDDAVICRWRIDDFILDIMPTDEKILGFSNRWYKSAIIHATEQIVGNNIIIKIVTAPYFLATKLEAFKQRGNKDFFASHDLEDIMAVVDGRPEIILDVEQSDLEIKKYLAVSFKELLAETRFLEALPGHLNYSATMQQQRFETVVNRMEQICTTI